jgi:hypothetical protein
MKRECLNRVVVIGEGHLRQTVAEFVAHYHHERPHQGRGNAILRPRRSGARAGRIRRHPPLGGLLNYYERAARMLDRFLGHYGLGPIVAQTRRRKVGDLAVPRASGGSRLRTADDPEWKSGAIVIGLFARWC